MATKKKPLTAATATPSQIRWKNRRDKVNKARRDKRKAARLAKLKGTEPTKLTNKKVNQAVADIRAERAGIVAEMASEMNELLYGDKQPENPSLIRARALLTTGRKKGGIEKMANDISRMIADARVDGGAAALANVSTRERHTRAINDERIVSAFIARMQVAEAALGTGLPPAIVISGLECAKIIDALRSAGYSNTSRQRNSSSDLMGREHARAESQAPRAV